ncbi:hypothetical protein BDQ17DRAFT_1419000 [Cyathus striatus]|nr:hypothetical protein BDQ17DRAFT_1419000 [Cyathus striatus]
MAAHQRRSPQSRKISHETALPHPPRKQYSLRATSRSYSHASTQDTSSPISPNQRKPLVPLQPNLRHPSSRTLAHKGQYRNQDMREVGHVVGTKRKRVASTNENAHTNAKSMRGLGSLKRPRPNYHDSDSESEMDIDTASVQWSAPDSSEVGEEQDLDENNDEVADEDEDDSKDEYYLHTAEFDTLHSLKKPDLVRLYELAGLGDDGEQFKKAKLAEAIISTRDDDDVASLPPSSPPRGAASDYSSDDGNIAGDEETDACPLASTSAHTLRRRATTNDFGIAAGRPLKGRSVSMGNILYTDATHRRKISVKVNGDGVESTSKRQPSNRSSPTTSSKSSTNHTSPLATRLRSRKVSNVSIPGTTGSAGVATRSKDKGKGKAKQVEFSNKPEVSTRRNTRSKDKERINEDLSIALAEDSDLTELDEEDVTVTSTPKPSPRRLRSKDREKRRGSEVGAKPPQSSSSRMAKTTRTRDSQGSDRLKSKARVDDLHESEDEMLEEDQLEEDEEMQVEEELDDDEEVDELESSTATTPPPAVIGRQTPLRRRLRPRQNKLTSPTESDDGDDEDEGDEEENLSDDVEEGESGDEDEGEQSEEALDDESGGEAECDNDDDEVTIAVEPKRLRNGKIVGEEDIDMEEDIGEEEEDEDEEAEEDGEAEEGSDGAEVEAEEDESLLNEEMQKVMPRKWKKTVIDWAVVTKKKLMKLRRDDLVQLCQVRDIEPEGNKQHLVQALLQWRDTNANNFSSPSSNGTARPPSTSKRRKAARSNSHAGTATPPVLLRSDHVHMDEPRTPIPGLENGKEKEEQDLELDLESLGLEDREIPPEKLTKLEKIGSGGFKDVFIGKFRGRKIAISEFRGQLSAMDIKELKLLGGFDHPNIVRFLGVSIPENTKETPVMIISELCSNGDLFDYIRNVKPPSLSKVLHMMLDIARGLEYLHTRKPSIIHRDCKSSNILITARGTAKIADFGLAKVKQSTRSMVRSLVGTVNWQAPELWHPHPKYNYKVDVFSCAMVFWEMLQWHLPNKKFPWEGMNEHAIYDIVGAKRQRPSISGLRKQWCPEIVDLIERMWAHEYQERPTMTEVVRELEEISDAYR